MDTNDFSELINEIYQFEQTVLLPDRFNVINGAPIDQQPLMEEAVEMAASNNIESFRQEFNEQEGMYVILGEFNVLSALLAGIHLGITPGTEALTIIRTIGMMVTQHARIYYPKYVEEYQMMMRLEEGMN